MKQLLQAAVVGAFALSLAACGGGGSASSIPKLSGAPVNGPASTAKTPLSSVTVLIPAASVSRSAASARKVLYISPNGNLVCITVQNLDPATNGQYISPYGGTSYTSCVPYNGSALTLTIPAPPGNDQFTISEYFVTPAPTGPTTALPTTGATLLSTALVPNVGGGTAVTVAGAGVTGAPVSGFVATLSSTINIVQGTQLIVGTGATQESVTVTAAPVGAMITANFKFNHAAGEPVVGVVNVAAGQQNQSLNTLLNPNSTGCPTTAGGTIPASCVPITLTGVISNATLSIATSLATPSPLIPLNGPAREQGAFLGLPAIGTNKILIPIPVTVTDASGAIIGGTLQTQGLQQLLTSGALTAPGATTNSTITITRTEQYPAGVTAPATPHGKLYVIDAVNGAIVQNETAGSVTINQLGGLTNLGPGVPVVCGSAVAGGDMPVPGSGALSCDPYIVVLAYDGAGAVAVSSLTVTSTVTLPGSSPSGLQTVVAKYQPQSMIYTANATTGYADPQTYTAALGMIANAGNVYVTDGQFVKLDGAPATVSPAIGTATTALSGIAFYSTTSAPAGNGTFFVTDSAFATAVPAGTPAGAGAASGIYSVAANLGTVSTLNLYNTPNTFFSLTTPRGIVGGNDGDLYAVDGNGTLWQIILDSSACAASTYCAFAQTVPGVSIGVGSYPVIGMMADPNGTSNNLYIADPGNGRITKVAISQASKYAPPSATVTAFTTGASVPFVGFTLAKDAALNQTAYYATAYNSSSAGIYSIPTTGGAPVTLGLAYNATAADGFVGVLTPFNTAAQAPSPQVYPVQGQATNFFGATPTKAPTYNVAPFCQTGAPAGFPDANLLCAKNVLALAPALGFASDAGGAAGQTASAITSPSGILYINSATVPTATLTPGSFLFTDSGGLRTLAQ